MPLEPEEEEREASSIPSTTTEGGGGGTSVDPEVAAAGEENLEASKSPSVKSKSPPETSSSSSPESDLELGAHQQMTYKSKDLPLPSSPERVLSVKRRLWDVDRREVDESLTRELKRIRQEESLVKSSKWNFDFEKEVPLRGPWVWEETESPPDFYKTKTCPKKKTTQSRFTPYERSSSISESVSSTSLPHTSAVSLVTSSRELTTLRSAVSSTIPTPEASTKECVESSSVQFSTESSEIVDDKQGLKTLPERFPTTHSVSRTSTATTSDPDIFSPDYFKRSTVLVEQCSSGEDIPKTSISVSSSTILASSSSTSVSNNGSSCVSSSSGNKINTEDSGKHSSSLEIATCSKSSSNSELEASKSSSSDHGIVPSCFYSRGATDTKEKSERGADSSTSTKSSGSSAKSQDKKKLKPPKQSSSEESSPSHLLKYYR